MQPPTASTLTMEAVSKRFARGIGADGVSLDLDAGELAGVWGRRRSGRSTLLRLAAGVERPDAGVVRLAGDDLWSGGARRERIAVWHAAFPSDHGRTVERQVAIAARRGRRPARAVRADTLHALERVDAGALAGRAPRELDAGELARVALARALVMRPRLLVLDEPMSGLDALEAQRLLELIAALARADRIAVLLSAADVGQLGGVDRLLSISRGVVRGATTPERAEVLRIRSA
ncbi:MAG TPA: ATP-binding cassette domain-containing protein [Conexibacter sp.]|nr:ATP-binding cassette domain-containing protein [Conexibacter sp.]